VPLPEPELVPVEPEPVPEFPPEAAFRPVRERAVERADFALTRDFAPRAPDPPAPVAADAPVEPPALRTTAEPAPGVLTPPVPLHAPDPTYPRLALRRGEHGTVLCRIHVDALGRATQVEIEESSGSERLDEAARATLATWTFAPATLDGTPSAALYRHRVRFELGG
jgi:protein TonB